jgi:hypothetical protein
VTHYQIASIGKGSLFEGIVPGLGGVVLLTTALLSVWMLAIEDGVVRANWSMSFKHLFKNPSSQPAPEDQPPCPEIMFDN